MELFSECCNICLSRNNSNLINLCESNDTDIKNILLSILGENIQGVYLCTSCCEEMLEYKKFKDKCYNYLIRLRDVYFNVISKLEEEEKHVSENTKKVIFTQVFEKNLFEVQMYNEFDDLENIYENIMDVDIKFKEEENDDVDCISNKACKGDLASECDCDTGDDITVTIKDELENVAVVISPDEYLCDKRNGKCRKNIQSKNNGMQMSLPSEIQVVSSDSETEFLGFDDDEKFIDTLRNVSIVLSREDYTPAKTYDINSVNNSEENQNDGKINLIKRTSIIETRSKRKQESTSVSIEEEEIPRKKHKNKIDKEKPTCSICNKTFTQKSSLLFHQLIHSGVKPYKCNFCEKSFRQSSTYNKHVRIHTNYKPFKCSFCNRRFPTKDQKCVHERSHTDERPYKCQFCKQMFKIKQNLLIHNRIHTGDRPYMCGACGKTFVQHSTAWRHFRRSHADTDSQVFRVSYTANKEQQHDSETVLKNIVPHVPSNLTKPDNVAVKQKEKYQRGFKCIFCKKVFKTLAILAEHKTNICEICNKCFEESGGYEEHMILHKKFYKCDVCDKTFEKLSQLSNHKRTHSKK